MEMKLTAIQAQYMHGTGGLSDYQIRVYKSKSSHIKDTLNDVKNILESFDILRIRVNEYTKDVETVSVDYYSSSTECFEHCIRLFEHGEISNDKVVNSNIEETSKIISLTELPFCINVIRFIDSVYIVIFSHLIYLLSV